MNIQTVQHCGTSQTPVSGECRICGAPLCHPLVDLGMSPLCEAILTAEQCDQPETYYPLHALVCERCFLVQLKQYVPPEQIFREYAYFSSYSTSWVEHARKYCEMITKRLSLSRNSLVVELASNDGYLLQHFAQLDVPVIGIEPAANVAKLAIERGIRTHVEFFGAEMARRLAADGTRADLIIANNVLAHVPDLNDFVAGIAVLLKPSGVATLEFPHLQRLMEETQFDTIYHEHFSYFSLGTVRLLAKRHGVKIIDVEELATHGGSLRVYLTHSDAPVRESGRVADLIHREETFGMFELATYMSFAKRVRRIKRNLLAYLIGTKDEGKMICGYGAPGKGNTLLNYCGIGTDFLEFTVDRNPYKHGRFTPGMHIPIYPTEMIDKRRPDYILILPWNLKQEIVQQMRHVRAWGCKFIVPIPDVSIIDPAERKA
ncbi:class I SAM-dependent methyltransferase [Dongia deserti]|uniref:class I SAM-dependent methyltransferase n=1 Tax=Dongia deserti TaxID=2268030 RepID=UPI0025466F47|nr:class I SAM-dependent methyltransferase [Dongia deserti]